jgi:hypothetical protein
MSAVLSSMPAALPAELRAFAQGPGGKDNAIQKVHYTHDAMIDLIIENPAIDQREIARHFGYTEGWVSQVFAADAFQARLAERKDEIINPALKATVEERFKALVLQSMEVLRRKLESAAVSEETALKTLEIAAKAAGYGARTTTQNIQQFVVQVPGKASSAEKWAEAHDPARGAAVKEASGSAQPSASSLSEWEDAVVVPQSARAPSVAHALDTKEILKDLKGVLNA